jgi:hypothetical protein
MNTVHLTRTVTAFLVAGAVATSIGVAHADPNDDPVLCPNHGCTRGPEGGQAEAEQQAHAGVLAEQNYLAFLRGQGVSAAFLADGDAIKQGHEACGTLAGGLGGGEPGVVGEFMAGGTLTKAAAAALVHGAHAYLCPSVVPH